MRSILQPLASLRLTVVIFALSIFLIFAGTLAQVHEGIWTVVAQYFRSTLVTIDLQIFVPQSIAKVPGAFWFPGGLTLGVAMLVNLIAAHLVRFKLNRKRAGIIITHLGVILLLVGEFVTGIAAKEGNMTILEGESVNYIENVRTTELAVIDQSNPDDDFVVVVPDQLLRSSGGSIRHNLLPFSITVTEWMPNSTVLGPDQNQGPRKALADSGMASIYAAVPIPVATGVDGAGVDAPSAYVTMSQGDRKLGSYLLSVFIDQPQALVLDGKKYWLQLRFTRTYKPFSLHLVDFKHDLFTGTQMARNYSSLVRLVDKSRNVDREVLIYMNHPLRHAGETFYQASFLQGDSGTVLQVVQNPGWLLPYISSTMITIGMLLHFGTRLVPALRGESR
ncbi:cytochrome c biogenesis protein ResB [PVC group bacterium]|nr:cytochrome c biogenesis protein ResB [PVC group bacterium]